MGEGECELPTSWVGLGGSSMGGLQECRTSGPGVPRGIPELWPESDSQSSGLDEHRFLILTPAFLGLNAGVGTQSALRWLLCNFPRRGERAELKRNKGQVPKQGSKTQSKALLHKGVVTVSGGRRLRGRHITDACTRARTLFLCASRMA